MIERIKTKNISKEIKSMINPFLERLKNHKEVIGIVILSSMATTGKRFFADEYSDVDLTVFFRFTMC